jgi:Domain of unknown function (DUF4126)
MDVLQTLSVALGLAALAGLNLYLTVFATGLCLHFGWVALPASLQQLNVLGDPWIVVIAGTLYVLEFLADKVPWVDTANDAVHTIIRPLGGAMLAVLALGDAHPGIKVIAALLAGGVALTSHLAKSSTRLVANTSPEPVSNIGLSLGEDVVVLGGLGLLVWHPAVALGIILLLLVVVWVVLPKLLRSTKAIIWLAWQKLNEPASGIEDDNVLRRLPGACELLLRRAYATTETVSLAVPCLSGGGPRMPSNIFGWLVRLEGGRTFFISSRWFGSLVIEIPIRGATIERESRFLAERLRITPTDETGYTFLFERGRGALANRIADILREPETKDPSIAALTE